MILLVDNYDSFSYNLVQFIGTLNPDIMVVRNDELTVDEVEALVEGRREDVRVGASGAGQEDVRVGASGAGREDMRVGASDAGRGDVPRRVTSIVLSPGPGYPKDAGICEDLVRRLQGKVPILGVCLGHQGICEVYGATICHAKKLMHGKQSDVAIDTGKAIFKGLPEEMKVARYHSLIADKNSMPDELEIIAEDVENHEVMAVKHRKFEVYGLQFHPESILTPDGMKIIENFLSIKQRQDADGIERAGKEVQMCDDIR